MVLIDPDLRVRAAAIDAIARLRDRFGDHVPAREIERGFDFEGNPVRFVGPGMGIFKPKILRDGPLTMRTTLASRYQDQLSADGSGLSYDFAPLARDYDNRGLTRLMELGRPLIYLIQVAPKAAGSEYAVFAPVWVSGIDRAARRFVLSLLPSSPALSTAAVAEVASPLRIETRWMRREVRVRLHQAHFRRIVLKAYRNQCAVCRLGIRPLLDAAHLIPDHDLGDASVNNGIGMCALHHRAFDRGILRVRPDFTVQIEAASFAAADRAAADTLVAFEGRPIALPRSHELHPSREALEKLYAS